MTLEDAYGRLSSIDSQAQKLMWDAGIAEDGLPWEFIEIKQDSLDEVYLRDSALNLMKPFSRLHRDLSYLKLPCTGEHPLCLFPDGKYGYEDAQGNCRIFSCGSRIEAIVPDRYGSPHWVRSRIEHNGHGYYLVTHPSVHLEGLVVRERKEGL